MVRYLRATAIPSPALWIWVQTIRGEALGREAAIGSPACVLLDTERRAAASCTCLYHRVERAPGELGAFHARGHMRDVLELRCLAQVGNRRLI